MSRIKTLFSSTALALTGTAVVIAVHDPLADFIGGAVALGALIVATRSGIQLAGEEDALDEEPPRADLPPQSRRTPRRP